MIIPKSKKGNQIIGWYYSDKDIEGILDKVNVKNFTFLSINIEYVHSHLYG